ncbi:chromosome segregation protein SMC [Yaniella halotolerans]|uniref:chromosome segregation protein SMC n=1 Tax=Yaniella halotolerans TaxID=225453 RepID=UPI0003B50AE3|nr:chromosome segregation protein SMC [Yaniella halotolerans]
MYLKTLTIRGFKSFASKTTFDFEPGITSVIGPNGSGKSNVVDALSWVMGEQGVKNLRGGKMEDVIFAGTSGRSPLGRAQVELTIDNADGTLPIDYSEVTISRTLFRTGGSEYQINGEAARLLDIQELLSDSGLGREMHVIVGQGQLDRILQATPEERRGFIEEAAGILKHRRRKERSERKLDSMRANLDRIRDLTDEVHRQLGPLSKQATTARKAQRIQHDVRDASARLLADEVASQAKRLEELVHSDSDLEKRQRQVSSQLEEAEKASERLSEQLAQISQAASIARDHRYQLTALAERYRSLQALANERYKTASRPPMASSGLPPEDAEKQLDENLHSFESSQNKVQALSQALSEAETVRDQAERQARISRDTHTQLVKEEADQQKALTVAESRKNSAEIKLNSLTSEYERLLTSGTTSSDTTTEIDHEVQEQETNLQNAERLLQSHVTDQESSKATAVAHRKAATDAELAVNRSKEQLSAARARVEILEQSLQPASGTSLAALKIHQPLDVSEIINIEGGWETAIAALLAGSTDRAWLASFDSAISGLATLQNQDVSDIRIFYPTSHWDEPLSDTEKLVQASAVVSPRLEATTAYKNLRSFLASAVLVEDLEEASVLGSDAFFERHPEVRIATRAGHVLSASCIDFHGDGSVSTLERRAEYDLAVEEVNRMTAVVEESVVEQTEAFQSYQDAQRTVDDANAEIQALRSKVATFRERIAVQKKTLEKQHAAQEQYETQRVKLHEDIEKARNALTEAMDHFEAVQAASNFAAESSTGVETATQAQNDAEQEAAKSRAAETEARLALRTEENFKQQAEQRVEQSRRRLSSAKIAQQEYQRALTRQQRAVQRLAALASAIETAIQRIDTSVQRADNDYQELEEQREALVEQSEGAEQTSNTSRQQLTKLQEQLHQRRLQRQEHELKLEQLHERSLNELGYSHQYLVTNFGPHQPIYLEEESTSEAVAFDRKEQEKRLRTAKRNLSALGKINPLALEEYEAVQERYEYLTRQLSDLEESRRDLLKIIEDVDATVLEVFTQAYEDTAAQFQHVFATLFPGGEGRLSLTEPDNMLETGIEVEARPAGKRVKRLSLLSGGERSLAAIAMLVSIFKARPSPFYVMDEVEAALDDTNLTRLLTIFRELQDDSQLIIITHQKRTMEISDALYGVSMRGDGVSQVISQKLDHVSSE